MFEEDFERCFICQAACKGLYCSSECRQQDKGSASPAVKSMNGVRLTAQLPTSLSPLARPHAIAPSPIFGARRRGNSSSSSSLSESPIQSPQTNPSGADSPQKDVFNLPPPAYPTFLGSVPVKIPSAFASRVPSANYHNGSVTPIGSAYPIGASVDTLRFGRKSSVTNAVTSPLALPRCGCGRPMGHRARSRDKTGHADDVACLSIGPSLTTADDIQTLRMVSDPLYRTPRTPNIACPPLLEERSITHVLGSSLLSRSRSDPIPPSPRASRAAAKGLGIHPRPALDITLDAPVTLPPSPLPSVAPTRGGQTSPRTLPLSDDRRGRSRERFRRPDMTPELSNAKLQHHEDREVAPCRTSRSRGRASHSRDRDRSTTRRGRGEERGLALNLAPTMRHGMPQGVEPDRGRATRVYA